MAENQIPQINLQPSPFGAPTHALVEVTNADAHRVLNRNGNSANLTRSTRTVSDKTVFVDNIADSVTQQEFIELMSEYATSGPIVDVKFLKRTKGTSFAFVEFHTESDGKTAINTLNSKDFISKSGKVLELRASRAENPQESVSNKNLYVKNIPRHWSNDDLKKRFRGFGSISHCRTLKDPQNQDKNTGVGFVHFFNAPEAAKAIEQVDRKLADPEDPNGPILEVKFARAKKPRGRGRSHRRNGKPGRGGFGRSMPNWNFANPQSRGLVSGRGRGRGGASFGGGFNAPHIGGFAGGQNTDGNGNEVWQKMVEIMQNMSMWNNPYQYNPNGMTTPPSSGGFSPGPQYQQIPSQYQGQSGTGDVSTHTAQPTSVFSGATGTTDSALFPPSHTTTSHNPSPF